MSAPTAPAIPPRPTRSPRNPAANAPSIPPRPAHRRTDRSSSPLRDSYAPSPLNDPPSGAGLARITSNEPPQRPPSVTIPSLGEEGIEYEDLPIDTGSSEQATPAETRNISSDLQLHAPKPSLPPSSAKAKVQAVTRTDSRQAAAAGVGKPPTPTPQDHDDSERKGRSLHSRPTISRGASSTTSASRRHSLAQNEEDSEVGQCVPMYPDAGPVQAPSPAPRSASVSSRHHHRSSSSRDILPPGSYGLHGHGVHSNDKFEKAWYEKHPDELAREEGQYGPAIAPRPDWALSSDDLNRIVRSSAVKGSGIGTSPAVTGTPEEEVGYIATEEYARLASPGPTAARNDASQPAVESPLRQANAPEDLERTRSGQSVASSDAGRVIHVDDPHLHDNADHTAQDADDVAVDDEPILAADEVRPESAFMHPAVSPRRMSTEPHEIDGSHSRTPSGTSSRPSSLHRASLTLARWSSRGEERDDAHTPLEDVEEYEPLFPDDDKGEKPIPPEERFKKRENALKHRFPSQDIWEDAPDSLQLQASVSTPEIPKEEPAKEAEEQQEKPKEQPESQVAAEATQPEKPPRPENLQRRFPSRDVWEDVPESQQLVTTVQPTENKVTSPENTKPVVPPRPAIPPRPQRAKPNLSTEEKKPPQIPERPKPSVLARLPKFANENAAEAAAPESKPRPAVPARPAGGKIAGLKANFLADLNSRLQAGPQGPKPKKEEKEETEKEEQPPAEKKPLSDARKGRARGPARRKPTTAAAATTSQLPAIPEVRIMDAWSVWEVTADGTLHVSGTTIKPAAASAEADKEPAGESAATAPPPEPPVTTAADAEVTRSEEEEKPPAEPAKPDVDTPAEEDKETKAAVEEPALVSTSPDTEEGTAAAAAAASKDTEQQSSSSTDAKDTPPQSPSPSPPTDTNNNDSALSEGAPTTAEEKESA